MESFSGSELGEVFDLEFALSWGTLPLVYEDPEIVADILSAYVNTYLKGEIQAEGLIRNVPPFVRFLAVAGKVEVKCMIGVYCGKRTYRVGDVWVYRSKILSVYWQPVSSFDFSFNLYSFLSDQTGNPRPGSLIGLQNAFGKLSARHII